MAPHTEHKPEKNKLSSILELQEFLKDELEESSEMLISRAFTPITDGLGLESPPKKEVHFPEKAFRTEIVQKTDEPDTLVEKQIKNFLDTPALPTEDSEALLSNKTVEEELAPPPKVAKVEKPAESLSEIMQVKSLSHEVKYIPPPLPEPEEAPLFKRAASVVIDQVFVMTLFILALVLTSNAMSGFTVGFSTKILQDFTNPAFVRFAVIEFAAIWLGYLAVCLFTMNTTFGMWVWGLRVSFGDKKSENYAMRKMMRVIWSFIFCAPIIPMGLLIIRKHGKNVIDILSGSTVCGSEA